MQDDGVWVGRALLECIRSRSISFRLIRFLALQRRGVVTELCRQIRVGELRTIGLSWFTVQTLEDISTRIPPPQED
jgi:hypothetical protein